MNELYESLEKLDRHIILAFRRVEEQRNRVLELRRRGEDATFSERLLAILICSLVVYEQRREHLVERLAVVQTSQRERRALSYEHNQ